MPCVSCQVYSRKNLLTSASKAAWSTETYEGNRKRPLKGHELFAQVGPKHHKYTTRMASTHRHL